MNYLKKFNEMHSNIVRVSCASLASIKIDNKYLICLNKNSLTKGIKQYTPFGGAIEFKNNALEYLNTLDLEFEKNNDLRFKIDYNKYDDFKKWFNLKVDRESSINRELIEELVYEENLLSTLDTKDFSTRYIRTDYTSEYKNNVNNYRIFEIYKVKLQDSILEEILSNIDTKRIYLASINEIKNHVTKDGVEIGTNCENIII